MDITDRDIQWLYSAFYIPAIFFNILYGIIMKKVGPKFTYVALLLMITGHLLFWIGVETRQYWMLIFG